VGNDQEAFTVAIQVNIGEDRQELALRPQEAFTGAV